MTARSFVPISMQQAQKGAAKPGIREVKGWPKHQNTRLNGCFGKPYAVHSDWGGRPDCEQAISLLENQEAEAILADKGYDADYIVDAVKAIGSQVVIPPKSNHKAARKYDTFLYKERNIIERMYGKLKHFRRVAIRYDKLAESYMSFVLVAAIYLWLK